MRKEARRDLDSYRAAHGEGTYRGGGACIVIHIRQVKRVVQVIHCVSRTSGGVTGHVGHRVTFRLSSTRCPGEQAAGEKEGCAI